MIYIVVALDIILMQFMVNGFLRNKKQEIKLKTKIIVKIVKIAKIVKTYKN